MGKDLSGKEIGKGFSQRKDGTYEARFIDRFGKRHSLYGASLPALRKEYKTATHQDIARVSVQAEFKLDEWYKRWFSVYKYHLHPDSKQHYAQVYEHHIKPVLGFKPLTKITTLDVRELINDLDRRGYGYETKSKVRLLLLDMIDKAIIDDFAIKNPVRAVKLERDEIIEPRVLSREEQVDFFDAAKGTFYEELYTVAVLTGLRPGEVYGLKWSDIDLKKRTIKVTRTLVYQKYEGDEKKTFHLGPPKTPSSKRVVHFDERCELALKSQFRKKSIVATRGMAPPLPGFEDLLFVTIYNTPINTQICSDAIRRIITLINENRSDVEKFERFSPHCFRHTYATRCFEAGVAPKVVQAQLGHASLKMTMDLYTHLFPEKRSDELEKFFQLSDDVFSGSDALREKRYDDALNPKIINF